MIEIKEINIVIEKKLFIPEEADPYNEDADYCGTIGDWRFCFPTNCRKCVYFYYFDEIEKGGK